MGRMITLTEEQRKKIVEDADKKVDMLSPEEREIIASRLNEFINLPFIGEEREQIILVKIVTEIDRFLYRFLPNEIYELGKVSTDGISEEEAELIETRMAKLINQHVNIPILTEKMEDMVFRIVLGLIIGAMRKNKSIAALAE